MTSGAPTTHTSHTQPPHDQSSTITRHYITTWLIMPQISPAVGIALTVVFIIILVFVILGAGLVMFEGLGAAMKTPLDPNEAEQRELAERGSEVEGSATTVSRMNGSISSNASTV